MESTPVKLYVDDGSQPSRACMIFCEMNNIPYEKVETRLVKGDNRKEEFLKINPLGQVPAMKHGEFCLREGHAIMKYLHASFDCEDHWYPACIKKRAKVDELLDWYHSVLRQGAAPVVFKTVFSKFFGMKFPEDEIKMHHKILKLSLKNIENIFLKDDFLAGPEICIADLTFYNEILQLKYVEYDLSKYPKLLAWCDRMAAIPEVQKITKVILSFIKAFLDKPKAKI
uniref:Glutathione transferase n=2 Tax=Euplotes crassus TaxID=5936 RepID=A0A7S3KCJ2_EUPCR|mmetsp:Transcript_18832/g.18495  ORF Transcript_18832/g.18495 Transcript_18832/m.18495 type:complete len:227 (+) Transcript_18832:25-705(+)|eukprot:CAMPEP_0197003822 /NCGR_PEP_ID=MMETSP1380-20130617/14476_1 /TAXON_ID=5936 /ORGANISM="Euplotes crassus, Strain CT5" /LENGTH=226 /DNA_ID=CAMNT_0042422427 /DNA_START=1 /DNA_END=681 /DNA_ORIENTATION=-